MSPSRLVNFLYSDYSVPCAIANAVSKYVGDHNACARQVKLFSEQMMNYSSLVNTKKSFSEWKGLRDLGGLSRFVLDLIDSWDLAHSLGCVSGSVDKWVSAPIGVIAWYTSEEESSRAKTVATVLRITKFFFDPWMNPKIKFACEVGIIAGDYAHFCSQPEK